MSIKRIAELSYIYKKASGLISEDPDPNIPLLLSGKLSVDWRIFSDISAQYQW